MGRRGIFEILLVDEDIRRMILQRTNTGEIKKVALEKGMLTLRMSGAQKVAEGITTVEEVIRVAQEDEIEV